MAVAVGMAILGVRLNELLDKEEEDFIIGDHHHILNYQNFVLIQNYHNLLQRVVKIFLVENSDDHLIVVCNG